MRTDWFNSALLLVALAASAVAVVLQSESRESAADVVRAQESNTRIPETLVDARGWEVATGPYQRIVSLNTVADHLLLNLVEPERLVAFTGYTQDSHEEAWRFGARTVLRKSEYVEQILGLRPDLVVTSQFADEAFMERIRERGVPVYDLGDMRGVSSTLEDMEALGLLLHVPERSAALRKSYERELAALLASQPDEPPPKGLYLSVLGDSFFGGTQGTSYADLLTYGGVADLAEEHGYKDWPRFNPEQLLMMNPKLILTQLGMAEAICQHSALSKLAACKPGGQILELHGRYHADPGLGIVEASQQIQDLLEQLP